VLTYPSMERQLFLTAKIACVPWIQAGAIQGNLQFAWYEVAKV